MVAETNDPRERSKPNRGAPAGAKPAPGLYVVATPIGNLRDITLRALDVLSGVDLIACEDTRVTGKLLKAHAISTPMTGYHDHNAERARPRLLARLAEGGAVALVSDAGTPLVSDPGYKLVRACAEAGIGLFALPGPSAALAALVVSGLPSDRVTFAGFPPARRGARRRLLETFVTIPGTLVFFESARRLASSLADMASVLGPRHAAAARELTKLHEEVRRGSLDELAAHYQAAGPPKGEVVIVVGPPEAGGAAERLDEAALDGMLAAALAGMSVRDAAAAIAAETGLRRRAVYERALALAGRRGAGK
ncbi:MAG: 16S rRNA (cytidine(1402)-2'-O)-methyltransferase [Alphaproteobacteria bacterium]